MCGIAGCVLLNTDQSVADSVRRMLDTIVHRGPDGWGIEPFDGHVGLGHRRLAILDLTEKGKQPMCRANRYWITFNGEIYNYLELRQELQAMGEIFRTDTDTEVLLAAYAQWGTECVSHFNGMWAFAIYDAIAQTLFCSRDRFGVKPFYYTVVNDQFFFASEIKALLAVIPQRSKADMTHLAAYLANGILDADEGTMFDGILQLLGGYNLLLDCRDLSFRISRWYDLRTVKDNNYTKEQNYALFREKFLYSVGCPECFLLSPLTMNEYFVSSFSPSTLTSPASVLTELQLLSGCLPFMLFLISSSLAFGSYSLKNTLYSSTLCGCSHLMEI